MNKNGDIIIIEDDPDDQFILELVFSELDYPNKRLYFEDGISALEHLAIHSSAPFLILSDINLPKLDGLELRKKLKEDADLNLRCIPYLFFTTALNHQAVVDAYSTSAQGFFVKPVGFTELKETLKLIIDYWKKCAAPNNF